MLNSITFHLEDGYVVAIEIRAAIKFSVACQPGSPEPLPWSPKMVVVL